MQFDTLDADFFQEMSCHSDGFHIGSWITRAKTLDTNLVEFGANALLVGAHNGT